MGVMFWSRIRARHAQVTTLNPALRRGNLLILKYDEDPLVREKYRQSQSWKSWCTAKPQQPSMHELGRACCWQKELLGSGMQHVIKTLQEGVDDKKAERETLLYVGYICHVCTTILFIPRMQIY